MTDRHAVIWTRVGESPIKMASLVMTPRECRITYTKDFVASGLPGLTLIADPAVIQQDTLIWKSTESRPLHPRLMALVPPNHAGNLQRRFYADILARQPSPPAPGAETEWAILLLAGHNGIGHVDVFSDDVEAEDWYSQRTQTPDMPVISVQNSRSKIWGLLKNEVRQNAGDLEELGYLAEIMGPTPTAGGMISKVLLSIPDRDTWTGEFLPYSARMGHNGFVDVIVKIEEPQYEGLLDLESLCLDIHRKANFTVPRSWRLDVDGLRVLAIERFDRAKDGRPIPFESLMTLFSGGSRKILSSADVEWPEVGKNVAKLGRLCNLDIRKAQETLFRRLAFALCTGNGDMHLDNIGLLGGKEDVGLAPVYDPAPMRAWPRHNMRMAVPVDFNGDSTIYQQIAGTAPAFGLSIKEGEKMLIDVAKITQDYCDRVMSLVDVPLARRKALVDVIKKERDLMALKPLSGAKNRVNC